MFNFEMSMMIRHYIKNLGVHNEHFRRLIEYGQTVIPCLYMCSNYTTKTPSNKPPPGRRGRPLTDESRVWDFNNWDNVVWDSTQEEEAKLKTQQQFADALPDEQREMYEEKASHFWDEFYNIHTNRFFKDRHWLFVEFPELDSTKKSTEAQANDSCEPNFTKEKPSSACEQTSVNFVESGSIGRVKELDSKVHVVTDGEASVDIKPQHREHSNIHDIAENFPGENAKFRILEVGCGVGNTVFPVLQTNNDPGLMVYCCDFSSTAIQIVKEHADYNPSRCHAFVCDISDADKDMPMPDGSLDIIIMIFVLSAINPNRMQYVINRLARLLKPGGQLLFRDYGRYDMAQLRFKKGRCLSENFYVRGDGTRVYFFTQEELKDMFNTAGLVENQNLIDRRLQVNRGKQLKMYRVWIQCKYQKPLTTEDKDIESGKSPKPTPSSTGECSLES